MCVTLRATGNLTHAHIIDCLGGLWWLDCFKVIQPVIRLITDTSENEFLCQKLCQYCLRSYDKAYLQPHRIVLRLLLVPKAYCTSLAWQIPSDLRRYSFVCLHFSKPRSERVFIIWPKCSVSCCTSSVFFQLSGIKTKITKISKLWFHFIV